jgi:hypothetical protein
MSPEQARGDKSIDQRADVYALGAILYELLSGKRPHPGDSHHAILHHISTQPAVPLASVQAELPEPLVGAVERALASDPNARPASADAFGQSIAAFGRRDVWPAGRGGDSGRVRGEISSTLLAPAARRDAAEAEAAEARSDPPAPTDRARRGPRGAAWLAVAGGAVATLAVVIAVVARGRAPEAAPLQPRPIAMPAPVPATPLPAPAPVHPETPVPPEPPRPASPPALTTDGDEARGPAEATRRSSRARKPLSRVAGTPVAPGADAQPPPKAVHFDQDNPYQ